MCPQNLLHFEDVPIKCPEQFSYYIEFICRRACAKKFKSEFHIFGWFPGLQILDVFFEKIFVELFWKSFLGRKSSLEPPVF